MSKRKILAAFKAKNIPVVSVVYVRGCPTPSGYANGWDITLTEEVENRLFDAGFIDCSEHNELDTAADVLEWIGEMPKLS